MQRDQLGILQESSGLKNLPANAGDLGLIPGLGKSPGGGNGNPFQENSMTEEPGRPQSMGLQRVGHYWVIQQQDEGGSQACWQSVNMSKTSPYNFRSVTGLSTPGAGFSPTCWERMAKIQIGSQFPAVGPRWLKPALWSQQWALGTSCQL